MDRGAWWATVHRVTKNWTGLKLLSARMRVHTHTHTHTHTVYSACIHVHTHTQYKQKQSNQWSPQSFPYHSPRTLSIYITPLKSVPEALSISGCVHYPDDCVYLPMEPAEIQVP